MNILGIEACESSMADRSHRDDTTGRKRSSKPLGYRCVVNTRPESRAPVLLSAHTNWAARLQRGRITHEDNVRISAAGSLVEKSYCLLAHGIGCPFRSSSMVDDRHADVTLVQQIHL